MSLVMKGTTTGIYRILLAEPRVEDCFLGSLFIIATSERNRGYMMTEAIFLTIFLL